MNAGFFHSRQHDALYYKLKREVVAEYQFAFEQATGFKKIWLRIKRRIELENRYNQLLFSEKLMSRQVV